MPKFNDIKNLAVKILNHNPQQSLYVQGPPGGGKTEVVYATAAGLDIPRERTIIFRPSLHDPVDLHGTPHINSDYCTHWAPPPWMKDLQKGRWMLGIDELPQAVTMMQNALAGLMLDRFIGELKLSPDVVIMATGNRTTDKAGANRMVGQLANRVMCLDMESDLDGWTSWALGANVPLWLISFLRFRPNHLNDYDPNRFSNPTERTHEMVGRLPDDLTASEFMTAAKGLVGAGCAAEMAGFKLIMDKMPNVDALLLNPKDAPVPTDPATLYALSTVLGQRSTKDNFDRVTTYTARMPKEFGIVTVRDAVRQKPEVQKTRAFVEWANANAEVLL